MRYFFVILGQTNPVTEPKSGFGIAVSRSSFESAVYQGERRSRPALHFFRGSYDALLQVRTLPGHRLWQEKPGLSHGREKARHQSEQLQVGG